MKRFAVLAIVALLTGCGGAKPVDDAAELTPPSAVAFVTLRTDLGSLPQVLRRFPFGPSTLAAVRRSLRLRKSLGPELDLAIFKAGIVDFTQPPDQKRFEASLGPSRVRARIRGWTAYTDKPALLDLVRHHEGALSSLPAYRAATRSLPDDAVVRAYAASRATGLVSRVTGLGRSIPDVGGSAKWVGAALSSSGDTVRLELRVQSSASPAAASSSELVSQIPADAVLAIGLGGLGRIPGRPSIGGVRLQGIADALGDDAVAWVRAGLPFPEVTIVSKPKDPRPALRDVGRLIAKLARPKRPPVPVTVDGATLQDVALGALDIYYGMVGTTLVVSDSTDAVGALRSSNDKLKVPGLPDKTNGFLYLDVEHALPALKAFAKLANQTIPAQLDADLEPLKTLVVYGARDGGVQTIVAAAQTR